MKHGSVEAPYVTEIVGVAVILTGVLLTLLDTVEGGVVDGDAVLDKLEDGVHWYAPNTSPGGTSFVVQ